MQTHTFSSFVMRLHIIEIIKNDILEIKNKLLSISHSKLKLVKVPKAIPKYSFNR